MKIKLLSIWYWRAAFVVLTWPLKSGTPSLRLLEKDFCASLNRAACHVSSALYVVRAEPFTRETTQIYTHVMQKPGVGVRGPLDSL